VEERRHFWNSRWGHLARHDIFLREDSGRWLVEDRQGGADGRSTYFEYDDEDAAVEQIRVVMATGDGWRELTAGGRW